MACGFLQGKRWIVDFRAARHRPQDRTIVFADGGVLRRL